MTLNYHHERSQVQQPQPLTTLPLPGIGPRLTFNPACIQNRRDSIDLEGMRLEAVRHMPLQPPPAVLAMARPLPPPPVTLPQVRFSVVTFPDPDFSILFIIYLGSRTSPTSHVMA